MKVGIVTIYDALNYGSFLQAYAMQMALQNIGYDVSILDCHSYTAKQLAKKWISRTDPIFYLRKRLSFGTELKELHIQKNRQQTNDVTVIGSDEVWNLKGYFDHVKEFFGENLNTDKIIAYAPSIGFCPIDFFAEAKETYKIRDFSVVFPRDEVTENACKRINAPVGDTVCDPTLLIYDEWSRHVKKYKKITEPYIVYYSYLDNTPMKEYIQRYAHEHNYKIIVANFHYLWGDKVVLPSPLQFLDLIMNAEYVFTSTIHGTIFSAIFEKKVIVRPSGQKVIDFMKKYYLCDRIYNENDSYDDFVKRVENNIDYKQIHDKFDVVRCKSIELLKNSIEG